MRIPVRAFASYPRCPAKMNASAIDAFAFTPSRRHNRTRSCAARSPLVMSSSSASDGVRETQLAALLATPSEDSERAYYARALAPAAFGSAVSVRRVTHGKGLVAARDFAEGERVLVEPPLAAMQQESNRADALVCGECFRYVGGVERQIARRLLADDATADAVDRGFLARLLEGAERLPHADRFPMPAAVPCPGGCDREVYCGEACAAAAWAKHERRLCPGPASESADPDAARAFLEHARDTNDIFILAAKVLLTVAHDAERTLDRTEGEKGEKGEKGESDDKGKAPENKTREQDEKNAVLAALVAAWEPFAHAHKAVWWEAVARPEDVAEGDQEREFRDSMRHIAAESSRLLASAVPSATTARFPGLFSLDVFSRVVGMFERNNLEIAVASPVEDYFLSIDALEEGTEEKASASAVTGPLLDALDVAYDAPCEGTGFFALQSCMNSDCDPNVAPMKDDEDIDGKCVLVAKRDISAGEELTMCYVDENADVETRRAELADYGFTCRCDACERESAA